MQLQLVYFRKLCSKTIPSGRTGTIAVNIYISLACKFLNMIISFIMVPITLAYLDKAAYGLWAAISSVIAWFFIFDIGIGNGLRNKYAECKAKNDLTSIKYYVSSAYFYFGAMFFALTIVFWIINHYIEWAKLFNAPIEFSSSLNLLMVVAFSLMSLNFVMKLINFILMGDLKTAASDIIGTVAHIVALAGIILLSKYSSPSLLNYAVMYTGSQLFVVSLASLILFNTKYKFCRPSIRHINRSYGRQLIRVGLKFFLLQISSLLLFQTTNFILSNLMGPIHVTDYNICIKYFSLASLIFTMLVNPLWSGYSDAYHRADMVWIANTIKKLKKLWLVVIVLMFVMLVLQKPLFKLWLKNRITVDYTLSLTVITYLIINMKNMIYNPLLNATSKLKLQIILSAIIPFVYLTLAVLFVKYLNLGSKGILIALMISQTIPVAIILPIHTEKILRGEATGIWS